ncbi:restriction endonuclease [Acidovorax sp. JHL-3]|uniref:restriction endonuclease n=1 Tax=Acidovorax sp. JHL-3 TaxID=1276755 RepID=UPI000466D18C|nr:restriction endonuclease [Acidovorax sp. JHL-3]
MAVPDFQSLMLPLLRLAGDGMDHTFKDAVEAIAIEFSLTPEERNELLPSSSRTTLFYNRLAWAKTHMTMAGLLQAPRRGVFCITQRGRELLVSQLARIDMKTLQQFPEYERARRGDVSASVEPAMPVVAFNELTPEESIERAHLSLRKDLARELLESIMQCSPAFFELLIIKLMIKMGYGGSREEAGKAVGRSGDGGIDGIINEDRLGLDAIYLQAKRWEGVVGRPEIMKFVGALAGQRATKGVFITTSWFTQDAKDYALSSQYKVVLIDGERLADLMIEHDLGVSVAATYQLKRIDSDFFSEE